MIDWRIILLTLLVSASVGWLWFVTVRDIVKRIRYLKSQEIANGTYNDNCDNHPKPDGVLVSKVGKHRNNSSTEGNTNNSNKKPMLGFHIKTIIKRLTTKCK